jgi:hypothetical protein
MNALPGVLGCSFGYAQDKLTLQQAAVPLKRDSKCKVFIPYLL